MSQGKGKNPTHRGHVYYQFLSIIYTQHNKIRVFIQVQLPRNGGCEIRTVKETALQELDGKGLTNSVLVGDCISLKQETLDQITTAMTAKFKPDRARGCRCDVKLHNRS